MSIDEIIEQAIQGHASTRDAIRWAMQQEREACAKVVEDEWGRWAIPVTAEEYDHMWRECAKAIRARGEK